MVEDADPDGDGQTNDRQEVEIRDVELDNAEETQRGSPPSSGHNECYRGGEKDALFIEGRGRVPVGFSDRAARNGGDEDESEDGSRNGDGGDGGDGDDGDANEKTQNSLEAMFGALQPCRFCPHEL